MCGGREGGGGGEFRGRAPVWDTCSMEFLGEDKADGSSTAVGERQQTYPPLSHTLPPLIVPLSLKHGAILRDQNEAGTDSLVWTQQTDTKSVCELPAGCETHRKWTFCSSKADSCRGGVSITTCIEWEIHLMLDEDIVEDFKCFSSVYSHKKHHNCFNSYNFSYLLNR